MAKLGYFRVEFTSFVCVNPLVDTFTKGATHQDMKNHRRSLSHSISVLHFATDVGSQNRLLKMRVEIPPCHSLFFLCDLL